jgi:hypothetical protein
MKPTLNVAYLASILFSAVMAFIYRKGIRSRGLIILLPYLFYIFAQEVTLLIIANLKLIKSNAIVYNIYTPLAVIVFVWFYYHIPFMKSMRKLMAGTLAAFLILTLINYCFVESIFTTSSYMALFSSFIITFSGILFLFQYFNIDNPEEEKYWHPLVWITVGLVIFYPVFSISFSFRKYLYAYNATLYGMKLYHIIPQVMSIFMYSCFSYAFYLCKKKI